MGLQVMASCRCGVEASFSIGGGMRDFTTVRYFPCLCEECRDIVQVNLFEKPAKCQDCGNVVIPYDSRKLSGSKGQYIVADWNVREQLGRTLKLTDGTYKCPRCGEMTLRFQEGDLFWD